MTSTIRQLNDAFRTTFQGGRVVMTRAVADLSPDIQSRITARVKSYDAFDEASDPHGEHDFGLFDIDGETIFFKIDYYNADMTAGSEDPADPAQTTRVLTIMLASDY